MGSAIPAAAALIEALMMALAFPDKCEPKCLGFSSSALTTPHKLFYKINAPWSPAVAAVANIVPANELFFVALNKHPSCVAIYNEWWAAGAVLIKTLQMGGNPPSINVWLNFNAAQRSSTTAAGNTYEPCFSDPDGEEGNYVWITAANTTVAITMVATSNIYAAATQYTLNWARRSGSSIAYGSLATTTGGAATNTIVFSSAALLPGYYAFRVSGNLLPSGGGVSFTSVTVQETVGAGGTYMISHDPLPANIAVTMDGTRVNAARATMTNFSGPFNAEGGAVAYELPNSERWDEYAVNPASGQFGTSIFTNLSNADGSEDIENEEGVSVAAHPDLRREPADNMLASGINGAANSASMMTAPSLDDIAGGVMLCIKTAIALSNARDGLWQIWYHTESQCSSQLFPKYHAAYSPLVILEAEALFKNFRLITHNPDHFTKGVQALRSMFGKGEALGDALISTGVLGGPGGLIKGWSGLGKKLVS